MELPAAAAREPAAPARRAAASVSPCATALTCEAGEALPRIGPGAVNPLRCADTTVGRAPSYGMESTRRRQEAAGARGAPAKPSLDNMLRRWQERVQRLWRPGSGRGTAALALLALLVAVWLGSGYYQVGPAERGVVQRFGRYVSTEQPGNGWHWPWPIETMTKLNVANIEGLDSKAAMLTAEQSLINIGWSVQYRIGDPLQYLFQLRDPETTLRQVERDQDPRVRGASAAAVAGSTAMRARGSSSDVRERIQQALDRLRCRHRHHQRESNRRAAARSGARGAARGRARQPTIASMRSPRRRPTPPTRCRRRRARHKSSSPMRRSMRRRPSPPRRAMPSAFTALADACAQSPQVTRQRLYVDAMQDILSHSRKIFIDAPSGTHRSICRSTSSPRRCKQRHMPRPPRARSATPSRRRAPEPAPNDRAADDTRSRQRVSGWSADGHASATIAVAGAGRGARWLALGVRGRSEPERPVHPLRTHRAGPSMVQDCTSNPRSIRCIASIVASSRAPMPARIFSTSRPEAAERGFLSEVAAHRCARLLPATGGDEDMAVAAARGSGQRTHQDGSGARAAGAGCRQCPRRPRRGRAFEQMRAAARALGCRSARRATAARRSDR